MSDDDTFRSPVAMAGKQQQRGPAAASRILQSPTSQNPLHILGSNDDQLERAQARAARAAANRRKSAVFNKARPSPDAGISPDLFAKEQVMELLQNCLKLASENKINQKNTWDLGLIDHLSELIKVEAEVDTETNFQKASCTLEAGVKIYSMRVDSVHSEAYKVLGGINRVGREDDKENIVVGDDTNAGLGEDGLSKKELHRKLSPLSTIESSFDALNVKKFDVAFTVDPLYHQTSAQFDEGGAKGLLLSNLGVYGGCKVLFDSLEAPGRNMDCQMSFGKSDVMDLSFAKEYIIQMLNCMPTKKYISPTLREIINQFDDENRRPSGVIPEPLITMEQDDTVDINEAHWEGNDSGPWNFDDDDRTSEIDDGSSVINPSFNSQQEENDDCTFQEFCVDDRFGKIAGFLSLGLGFTSKVNSWAGPDHWKYKKVKGAEQVPNPANDKPSEVKKTKSRKQSASDFEFTKSLDMQMPNFLLPPKNPRTLLLPTNRAQCNITLPEDCHYQPENLVKLFCSPNVMCMGKKNRRTCEEPRQGNYSYDTMGSWDNENTFNDQFDDGNALSDVEDPGDLVSQPRQVSKIEVEYDKYSKQVDVHALKGALWSQIQVTVETSDKGDEKGCSSAVSFRQMLGYLVNGRRISSRDISPHLCFICLLHLANEHCLKLSDYPTLDELDIYIPAAYTL